MDAKRKHDTLFPGSQGFQIQWDALARGSTGHGHKLGLPSQVTHSKDDSGAHNDRINIHFATPWRSYKRWYNIELDTSVTICQKIPPTAEVFGIRKINDSAAMKRLQFINGTQHKYFLHCLEVFVVNGAHYTVSEYVDISLKEIIRCPAYLNDAQLASIIFQVLDAIVHLQEHEISLSSLQEGDILLLQSGDIRFAYRDNFLTFGPTDSDKSAEICRALGRLMVTLMEKVPPDGDQIKLEEPDRWKRQAVDFLAHTASTTPQELLQHDFLRGAVHPEELGWLVRFAQTSARRIYNLSTGI